jgi:hypothetical protein
MLTAVSCAPKNSTSPPDTAAATAVADDLVKGQYADLAPRLNDTMKSAMSESMLTQISTSLKVQYGDPVSVGDPRTAVTAGYNVVYIPYKFQQGAQDIKVVFDGAGKVGGLFVVAPGAQ